MMRMRTMVMMTRRRWIRPRCCQTLASPDSCQLPQALVCLRSPRIDISTFCLLVKILYVQCFHHLGWSSCAWGIDLQFASSPPSSWRSSPPLSSHHHHCGHHYHHHHHHHHRGCEMRPLLPRVRIGKPSTEHFGGQRVLGVRPLEAPEI